MVVSLIIERKTSQSIELSWRAPSKLNGRIGYHLYYWKKTSDSSTGGSFVLGGQTTRKIVGDLKPFTEYTFSVFAYNLRKNLSGPESTISAMTDSAGMNSFYNYVFKENSAPQTRKSNERVSLHDKLKLVDKWVCEYRKKSLRRYFITTTHANLFFSPLFVNFSLKPPELGMELLMYGYSIAG